MAGEGWTEIRLGDVCTKIGSGATPRGGSSVYFDVGEIALIRSQNIYNDGFRREGLVYLSQEHADQLSNVEVQKGDVLLNITGDSVARCCQVDTLVLPARVNQHVAIIRPVADHLNAQFLRYVLVSPQMQEKMLSWAGSGGTRNALTKAMIESFYVSAPKDTKEQQAIGCILGSLDDKIELNRQMNQTLEAMARAIFKSWFVDFDPVRAKASGKPPSGLVPAIADLFPDALDEEDKPKGWSICSLGDVTLRITKGTTPRLSDYEAVGDEERRINFIRVNAISDNGEIIWDKIEKIPESIHIGALKRSMLQKGDVLYTIAGTIGRVSIVEKDLLPANTNQTVAIIRPDPDSVPSRFLLLLLSERWFQEKLHTLIVQAVQANLSLSSISKVKFIVPHGCTLLNLFGKIDVLFEAIRNNQKNSRSLGELRTGMLPKLVSGELRIPDAERIVGRCT